MFKYFNRQVDLSPVLRARNRQTAFQFVNCILVNMLVTKVILSESDLTKLETEAEERMIPKEYSRKLQLKRTPLQRWTDSLSENVLETKYLTRIVSSGLKIVVFKSESTVKFSSTLLVSWAAIPVSVLFSSVPLFAPDDPKNANLQDYICWLLTKENVTKFADWWVGVASQRLDKAVVNNIQTFFLQRGLRSIDIDPVPRFQESQQMKTINSTTPFSFAIILQWNKIK